MLIGTMKRQELLEDLYEYDKCFYINHFQVNINEILEPKKKRRHYWFLGKRNNKNDDQNKEKKW